MEFTIKKYKKLLDALISNGYVFQTFEEFLNAPKEKVVILRHDVDALPENSLLFAKLQKAYGIKGSYYFRTRPESYDEKIIVEISGLGHEIGYHYECLAECNGDFDVAINQFKKNLTSLRGMVRVSTICMHGTPRSDFDSKDLWNKFNYRDYDLLGEPYFDIDFDLVFYLTDTGRMWDAEYQNVSVRDIVKSSFTQSYHKTDQIIKALNEKQIPNQIMFTFHPQRWTDSKLPWIKEFVFQKLKNVVKSYLYVKN